MLQVYKVKSNVQALHAANKVHRDLKPGMQPVRMQGMPAHAYL